LARLRRWTSLGAPNEPTMTPSAAAPLSARDQAVGVLMIALFFARDRLGSRLDVRRPARTAIPRRPASF